MSLEHADQCPTPSSSTLDCGADQAFCDAAVSFDPATGLLTIDEEIADATPGTVNAVLTINPGATNEATTNLVFIIVDPCEAHNAVTLAPLSGWATEIWITDEVTFTIDPATDLSHTTTPAGADCGAYTVELSLKDADGNDAPASASVTIEAY